MRNLASVVTIKTKQKMFEKDKICCVSFEELGYEAIVPNTFNVGDKLVFIQEGAILPETETWEFLRKRCYKEQLKGFLISPMTMGAKEITDENGNPAKGERVRSWGLAVGLNECGLTEGEIRRLKPGVDVTDALQIRKYEPIEDASPKGDSKKTYPKWVKFCLDSDNDLLCKMDLFVKEGSCGEECICLARRMAEQSMMLTRRLLPPG